MDKEEGSSPYEKYMEAHWESREEKWGCLKIKSDFCDCSIYDSLIFVVTTKAT